MLALVAGQDVEPAEGSDGTDGRWRIARQVAPDRVISTVDPDARHAHKTRSRRQDGYTAHIVVEPDTGHHHRHRTDPGRRPGQLRRRGRGRPAARATPARPGDGSRAAGWEVLGDSAYGTGDALAALRDAGHTPIIKPWPLRPAVEGGFTIDDFTVIEPTADQPGGDLPERVTRPITPARNVTFGAACRGCPLRARCTTSTSGRTLRLQPRGADRARLAARGRATIEHVGSAHDEQELEALKAAARQRLAGGQGELDLGPGRRGGRRGRVGRRCRSRPRGWGHLWDGAVRAPTTRSGSTGPSAGTRCSGSWCWRGSSSRPASSTACGCWPRPASTPPSYRTLNRRLPVYADDEFRRRAGRGVRARTPRLGPASLVLYDVSHAVLRDRRRGRVPRARVLQGTPPGAADHHRAAHRRGRVPADGRGVRGQHGRDHHHAARRSRAFMAAHQLRDVTVVADAGMVSDGQQARDRGRRAVVHPRRADPRHPLRRRRSGGASTPTQTIARRADPHPALARRAAPTSAATRSSTTSTGPTGPGARLRGIDEQVAKAETRRRREGAGQAQPVHPASSAPTSP